MYWGSSILATRSFSRPARIGSILARRQEHGRSKGRDDGNRHEIPFGTTDWGRRGRNGPSRRDGDARWRTRQFGEIRVRLVEYSPGYLADHWCEKGHILYVLDGVLETELGNGRTVTLMPGTSYQVADGAKPHRSSTATGARLFIVVGRSALRLNPRRYAVRAAAPPADDGVERAAAAGRRAVETADVAPIPRLHEMLGNQAEVPGLVEQAPARDRRRREASLGEGHDQRRARPQDACDLSDQFGGADQMLDRAADRRAVELAGGKGKLGLAVEVLHPPLVEKRILRQRTGVRSDADNPAVADFRRQMADPARRQVEDGAARRHHFAVEVGDRGDRGVVDAFGRETQLGDRLRLLVERRKHWHRDCRHTLAPITCVVEIGIFVARLKPRFCLIRRERARARSTAARDRARQPLASGARPRR